MRVNKETIILALVIAASIAYLAGKNRDGAMYDLPTVPSVNADAIDHIRISRENETIDLEKQRHRWIITPQGHPADGARVKGMQFSLEDLAITALISESRAYARYDLGDKKRIHVKAWAGGDLKRDVFIGKEAATYQHTHVRLPDDPRVYLARGDFRRKFDRSRDDIRDKSVMAFAPDDITQVVIQRDGQSFKVTAEKTSDPKDDPDAATPRWRADGGSAVDGAAVKRLLTTLSRLECKSFTPSRDGVPPPEDTVIRLAGQQSHALHIGTPAGTDEEPYPGASSDIPYAFELAAWEVENLVKTIDDITGQGPGEKDGTTGRTN